MKHTPGPWYVKFMHENEPDSDFWVKSDVNPKVYYGTDIMCDDYGEHNGYPREQRLADAKLIAAAPDMLETLIEISEGKGRYNEDKLIHASNTVEDMKQLAKDAIKKARNE